MRITNGARRTAREVQGSVRQEHTLTPAEKRAIAKSHAAAEKDKILGTVHAAVASLAEPARSDGDQVLAIFDAVMRKESRALVRRDLLDDVLAALRDMGCEHEMPTDSPKWRRLKSAYRALKGSVTP